MIHNGILSQFLTLSFFLNLKVNYDLPTFPGCKHATEIGPSETEHIAAINTARWSETGHRILLDLYNFTQLKIVSDFKRVIKR